MELNNEELQLILQHVGRGEWAVVNNLMVRLVQEAQRRNEGPATVPAPPGRPETFEAVP